MNRNFAQTIKSLVLVFSLGMSATPLYAADVFVTDQGHSEVRFSWDRAGISVQTGEFTEFEGVLTLDPDNIEASSLTATIKVKSLSSGFEPLDKELLSANFFDAETYPEITFKSTKITRTGDNTADVIGDMTIHGVTKPVTLATTLTHRGAHPYFGYHSQYNGNWAAFSATTQVRNMAFKVGSYSAGAITITIATEMKQRDE